MSHDHSLMWSLPMFMTVFDVVLLIAEQCQLLLDKKLWKLPYCGSLVPRDASTQKLFNLEMNTCGIMLQLQTLQPYLYIGSSIMLFSNSHTSTQNIMHNARNLVNNA